jgi:hypothetical protein
MGRHRLSRQLARFVPELLTGSEHPHLFRPALKVIGSFLNPAPSVGSVIAPGIRQPARVPPTAMQVEPLLANEGAAQPGE